MSTKMSDFPGGREHPVEGPQIGASFPWRALLTVARASPDAWAIVLLLSPVAAFVVDKKCRKLGDEVGIISPD
jgi:hypothetical protein